MIVSGIILAVIGYMSGLTVLKAIGGILIVVMWGSSRVFWPAPMPGFEAAGADIDARRPAAGDPNASSRSALGRRAGRHGRAAAFARAPRPPRDSARLRYLRRNTRSAATSAPARGSRRALHARHARSG